MQFLSLLIGKAILKTLRLMGRTGSALPGLVVERLNPGFLAGMLNTLPEGVVLITGTNGKTTTTKVTTALLEAQGLRVLTNKTGSNFVRGTVTTVLDKATWGGKLPYDIAVYEQDEAHAVHFVNQVKPRGVAVLNIMRDQMDRFGEIDTTARLLKKVVENTTGWVILNANDERVAKLQTATQAKVEWYGHSQGLQSSFLTDDELHHRDDTTYSRAGDMLVELAGYDTTSVTVAVNGHTHRYETPLSGSHNAINLAAALAIVRIVRPQADQIKLAEAVKILTPAFGRGEVIGLTNGGQITLQLVKNPGGFSHALRLLNLKSYGLAAIAINDDYADGRDVSWLWDVDFMTLEGGGTKVICGGSRGHDMAVRLKYDGITAEQTETGLPEFVRAVNEALPANNQTAIIFCTYTAMLKIRAEYKKYSADVYGVSV